MDVYIIFSNKNIISDFIKMKGIQTETKIKSWSAVERQQGDRRDVV